MSSPSTALPHQVKLTDGTSPHPSTGVENPYYHLRITVTCSGCHSFKYLMSLGPASKIDVEDTVFGGEEDVSTVAGEGKVVIDEPLLELLHGSTVDYTTELI
ncbi:hypothetical protein N7510_010149 [Penicillium lagena]|uniref:uncharacterized protein n=1 Tax=Penicillium lagena TaxID=94218 RepID=UPI00253FBAC7|nr:uncharacterized protein N7510_010149 [Penicillium lagena]KAJ5604995.1 hypothetical protein N7510_010149 [Penicillium lagena]